MSLVRALALRGVAVSVKSRRWVVVDQMRRWANPVLGPEAVDVRRSELTWLREVEEMGGYVLRGWASPPVEESSKMFRNGCAPCSSPLAVGTRAATPSSLNITNTCLFVRRNGCPALYGALALCGQRVLVRTGWKGSAWTR